MGSFARLRRRHRRGNPSCCAWSRTSRTGLTNRCTPPKRVGGNPLEARLRRYRWVTVRELVPTSQARLYPPKLLRQGRSRKILFGLWRGRPAWSLGPAEGLVDLAGDVALEAADDLFWGF